jgi:hypothetical protein
MLRISCTKLIKITKRAHRTNQVFAKGILKTSLKWVSLMTFLGYRKYWPVFLWGRGPSLWWTVSGESGLIWLDHLIEMSVSFYRTMKLSTENLQLFLGKKDQANTRLAQALVGTMPISAVSCEILTILRPVIPKHVGTAVQNICILTSKKVATFLNLFQLSELIHLGRYCTVICAKFGMKKDIFNNKLRAYVFLFTWI